MNLQTGSVLKPYKINSIPMTDQHIAAVEAMAKSQGIKVFRFTGTYGDHLREDHSIAGVDEEDDESDDTESDSDSDEDSDDNSDDNESDDDNDDQQEQIEEILANEANLNDLNGEAQVEDAEDTNDDADEMQEEEIADNVDYDENIVKVEPDAEEQQEATNEDFVTKHKINEIPGRETRSGKSFLNKNKSRRSAEKRKEIKTRQLKTKLVRFMTPEDLRRIEVCHNLVANSREKDLDIDYGEDEAFVIARFMNEFADRAKEGSRYHLRNNSS